MRPKKTNAHDWEKRALWAWDDGRVSWELAWCSLCGVLRVRGPKSRRTAHFVPWRHPNAAPPLDGALHSTAVPECAPPRYSLVAGAELCPDDLTGRFLLPSDDCSPDRLLVAAAEAKRRLSKLAADGQDRVPVSGLRASLEPFEPHFRGVLGKPLRAQLFAAVPQVASQGGSTALLEDVFRGIDRVCRMATAQFDLHPDGVKVRVGLEILKAALLKSTERGSGGATRMRSLTSRRLLDVVDHTLAGDDRMAQSRFARAADVAGALSEFVTRALGVESLEQAFRAAKGEIRVRSLRLPSPSGEHVLVSWDDDERGALFASARPHPEVQIDAVWRLIDAPDPRQSRRPS